MPTLTREEAFALAGLRRLLVRFAACLPAPPANPEADGHTLILKELKLMSDTFDTAMSKLSGDVAAQSTVIASATQAFRGLVAQLVSAEAAAKNAGATDLQVAGVTQVRQQLEANTASLAAAIPANTDQATTPAPTTTPDPATPVATTVPTTPVPTTTPDPVVAATPVLPTTPSPVADPTLTATSSVAAAAPAPSAAVDPAPAAATPAS